MSQGSHYDSSQDLLCQYPEFNYGMRREHRVYILELRDSEPVWVGCRVTLIFQDEMHECVEYYEGKLIGMCEQRKNTAWFVFKDGGTKKLHLVEVRNGMIKWPLWRKILSYLYSFPAYVNAV